MIKHIVLSIVLAGSVLFAATAQVQEQQPNQDPVPTKNPAAHKIMERLYGVWRTTDAQSAQSANTQGPQSIEFNPEAKYVMKRGDQVTETGSYRVNEQHSVLYLEGSNSKRPMEWKMEFEGNNLILSARGANEGKQQRIVYTKDPGADTGTLDERE